MTVDGQRVVGRDDATGDANVPHQVVRQKETEEEKRVQLCCQGRRRGGRGTAWPGQEAEYEGGQGRVFTCGLGHCVRVLQLATGAGGGL